MFLFKRDTWSEVFHALSKNKARTFITMIGVAWGMLLFVFLLGLVNGMRNGFDRDLKGTSTNSMFVWADRTSIPYKGFGRGRQFDLKLDDVKAIKNSFPEVQKIAPRNVNQSLVTYKGVYGNYQVYGDYPEQNEMFKNKIISGRFINDDDIETGEKVAVIGEDIVDEIFQNQNPVGKLFNIGDVSFKVVGVYESSQGGPMSNAASIFIPYATFQKMFNQGNNVRWMAINLVDDADLKETEDRIKQFLKKRHDVAPNDTQAIGSFNLGAMFGKIFNFMKGLEFLTVIVGFLTLFSGVIAISSILLITVKERTQEFGIRRALGAQPWQIIAQILLESAVITFFSGIIGITLGTLILSSVNQYIDNMPKTDGPRIPLVNASVDINVLGGAFLFVLIMAIFAGMIPAIRAISIKPIDALRDE